MFLYKKNNCKEVFFKVKLRTLGNKRGAIGPNAVISIMLAIAVIVIVSIMVFSINQDAREDLTAGGYGYNATADADVGVSKITDNLDLVGLGVAFGFVISIILGAIAVKRM